MPEIEALRAFRQQVYALFGCRRDALFEALDAVLSAPTIETPAHLSLVASCRHGWGSLYDALNAGTMDLTRLEWLVASYPREPRTTWFAVGSSVWPRRTPARVRRGFSHVLVQLGTPACAPKPCGRSPGRPSGKRSPPAPRFPAVKLAL